MLRASANVFQAHYPVSLLMLWFGSFALLFAVSPDWLTWGYIVTLPLVIVYDVYRYTEAKTFTLRLGVADVTIALYIVYGLWSIFRNSGLPLARDVYLTEFLFRAALPMLMYWFIRVNPLEVHKMPLWVWFLAGLTVLETLFGFITLFAPLILPEPYQPRAVHLYTRATGTFVTPSAYVLTLIFGMAFVFLRRHRLQPSRERLILTFVVLAGVIGVLISQNRGGWLVLPIVVIVMIAFDRGLWRWLVGTIVAFSVVFLLVNPGFFSQSLNRLTEWRQVESRITMGMAGLELFLARPMFGWGYGTYDLHDWRFMRTIGDIEPTRYELSRATSHNTYLTLLGETGVVGFALYMFTTAYWLVRSILARVRSKQTYDWELVGMMWLLIIVINIAAQFADFRFFPFVSSYWWLALGIVANELSTQRPS